MKSLKSFLIILISIFLLPNVFNEELLDISDYPYPKPDDSDAYRVAIFATTDLHGRIFPMIYFNSVINQEFESGGVEYMGTYIDILKKEWGDRFLWFDTGDQMRGSIEYDLSKGEILHRFYNTKRINAMSVGNHEFDGGLDKLRDHMTKSTFDYLVANIKENGSTQFLPRQLTSNIYTAGKVKIGVIGVTTNNIPTLSGGNTSTLTFLNHRDVIIEEATKLRNQGVNAIILLAHMGPSCKLDMKNKMKLGLWTKETEQLGCITNDEYDNLITSLPEGIIDMVIAGHMHDVTHHWIHNIPVVQSTGSDYSNVIYLPFEPDTLKLIPDKIILEGPLPSCNKVFDTTRRCEFLTEKESTPQMKLLSFTYHNEKMVKDLVLEKQFEEWYAIIKKKQDTKLGETKSILFVDPFEETTLANLVTDLTRRKTGADVALFNYGGIRATWYPKVISEHSLDTMFPFDDPFASFDMTGEELERFIHGLHRKLNIVPTSGLVQTYKKLKDGTIQILDIKINKGGKLEPINHKKMYRVGSIAFLLNKGGDGINKIFEWYTKRNYKESYGGIKTAMKQFLPLIGEIDNTMFIDRHHPRARRIE